MRTEPWGEFILDSPVKVTAERFKGKRGVKWSFRSHVLNSETLTEWVEVFGGPSGYESTHAFRTDEISLIKPKKRRKRHGS